MRRAIVLSLSLLCLTAGFRVYASEDDRNRWESVTEDMSFHEYRKTCRNNQRIVRKFLKTRSMNLLGSVGIPEVGAKFVGAAAGLAANLATNRDMKLGLNKDRTMLLEFRDPVGNNQSMLLRFRIDW